MAHELAEHVGGQVVLDETHQGTFPNHVRALGTADGATHVVVLEDDAIICADFTQHVERLIEQRPSHLLGLYVGRQHPRKPQPVIQRLVASQPAWLDAPAMTAALWWAVGYVMPVKDLPSVLADLDAGFQHPWADTDKRLGHWHAEQGRLSYPFPSPVDHNDDIPSTVSKNRTGRVAWAHCERRPG